jgi:hypothetical protein
MRSQHFREEALVLFFTPRILAHVTAEQISDIVREINTATTIPNHWATRAVGFTVFASQCRVVGMVQSEIDRILHRGAAARASMHVPALALPPPHVHSTVVDNTIWSLQHWTDTSSERNEGNEQQTMLLFRTLIAMRGHTPCPYSAVPVDLHVLAAYDQNRWRHTLHDALTTRLIIENHTIADTAIVLWNDWERNHWGVFELVFRRSDHTFTIRCYDPEHTVAEIQDHLESQVPSTVRFCDEDYARTTPIIGEATAWQDPPADLPHQQTEWRWYKCSFLAAYLASLLVCTPLEQRTDAWRASLRLTADHDGGPSSDAMKSIFWLLLGISMVSPYIPQDSALPPT